MNRKKVPMLIGILCLALIIAVMPFVGACAKEAPTEKVTVIIPNAMPSDLGEGRGLYILAEKLRTDPRVKDQLDVKYYPNGMLYDCDGQMIAVESGAAHITYSSSYFLESFEPEWKILIAPALVEDWEHTKRIVKTPAWEELRQKTAEKDVLTLAWFADVGDWYLYSSKGAIHSFEDLKGQTFRYPGGELFDKVLRTIGVTGIPLPFAEVVTALETGMIDGLVTDMFAGPDIFDLFLYAPHCLRYKVAGQPMCYITNTTWWNSLDPGLRHNMEAVIEDARVESDEDARGIEAEVHSRWLADPNTTCYEPTPEQKVEWDKMLRQVVEEVCEGLNPDLITACDATRE